MKVELTDDEVYILYMVVREHINARLPISEYVANRYDHMDDKFRAEKAHTLGRRILVLNNIQEKINPPTGEAS